MRDLKVRNMTSAKGNKVANQFILSGYEQLGNVEVYTAIFQSYGNLIVKTQGKNVLLDKNTWNHSTTTGRYRNKFLNETKKETEAKIKSGEYMLVDLNGD